MGSPQERKFARVPVDITTRVLGPEDCPHIDQFIHLVDMSGTGASFESKEPYETGSLVEFEFPPHQPVHVGARIVSRKPATDGWLHGTVFVDLNLADLAVIERHLHRLMREQGIPGLSWDLPDDDPQDKA